MRGVQRAASPQGRLRAARFSRVAVRPSSAGHRAASAGCALTETHRARPRCGVPGGRGRAGPGCGPARAHLTPGRRSLKVPAFGGQRVKFRSVKPPASVTVTVAAAGVRACGPAEPLSPVRWIDVFERRRGPRPLAHPQTVTAAGAPSWLPTQVAGTRMPAPLPAGFPGAPTGRRSGLVPALGDAASPLHRLVLLGLVATSARGSTFARLLPVLSCTPGSC